MDRLGLSDGALGCRAAWIPNARAAEGEVGDVTRACCRHAHFDASVRCLARMHALDEVLHVVVSAIAGGPGGEDGFVRLIILTVFGDLVVNTKAATVQAH